MHTKVSSNKSKKVRSVGAHDRAHEFEKAIISWQAPEYQQHEKSLLWFIIAAIAAGAMIMYGLSSDGWTFSIAVAVFAGVYYLVHRKKPAVVEIKISGAGVKIGHHLFPYSGIKNFWIVNDPQSVRRLYMRSASRLRPDVFVALENADASKARSILKEHIEELEESKEPFADTLVRLLRL